MRIGLSIILSLLLTLRLSALPNVRTGSLPDWLIPIHPDLSKQPAKNDISDGYYYQLLDLQTSLTGKTRYTHYIKDISNESGVQNASEVSVTFAPEFQQVVFHRITILRNGASLNRLDLSRIKVIEEERDADDFEYNGLKRAFIILKDVRKGDRIEVAYSVIGFNPVFGNKFSDDFTFGTNTAICNYYRTLLTTPDRPLQIITLNKAATPVQQRLGNTLAYSWKDPHMSSEESGAAVPSWFDRSPSVYITEYKNWAEVIDWGMNTFNHYHFSLPPALQKIVASWNAQAKGNKDLFANIATRFVQNEIRYLGLEIGVNTHQPHSPSAVFDQRFGDCKDKALLLAAILQSQDIPASVALVSTDTRGQLVNIAPSPRDFDHAIVAIRRSKDTYLFVDPTNSGQRGELADLFIPDYGYALVLEEGATNLQPVKPGRINDFNITEQLDAKYYTDSSRFTVTSIYSGGVADDIRGSFEETSLKDIEERYRKYYAADFDGIRLDGPVTYSDDSLKNEFTVHEHYTIPQLWSTDKKGKRYFEFSVGILEKTFPDPKDATGDEPLALHYPYNIHYTLNLVLPEDWEFTSGGLHIKNADYQFDFDPIVNGKNMSLHYSFKSFHDHIPASAVQQYRKDYKHITNRIAFQLYKTMLFDDSEPEDAPAAKQPVTPISPLLAPSTPDWHASWPAIWLTFFFSLFFSRLFVWLNSRKEETLYAHGPGFPLGGWLILLGVSIGVNLIWELIQLVRGNYYSQGQLLYLKIAELALHLSFLASGSAVFFWFIKKRDIFPRMFLFYISLLLSGRILLILIHPDYDLVPWLILTAIYSAFWVTYILRSGQVKSTFLEPFRRPIK